MKYAPASRLRFPIKYMMIEERKHWKANNGISVNALAKTIALGRWKPKVLCFWMMMRPVTASIDSLNCSQPLKSPANNMMPPLEYAPFVSLDSLKSKDEIMSDIETIVNSFTYWSSRWP